jgi:STAS domain
MFSTNGPCLLSWANACLIQILVLQNFLFFGNSQSVLQYVMTMFEEPTSEAEDDDSLFAMTGGEAPIMMPLKPRYVVIDFAIVTGLDISAVDILREISALCSNHGCRLIFSGLSPSLKSKVIYGGISPNRAFASDLESALITAEDLLINNQSGLRVKDISEQRETNRTDSYAGDGFILALQKIDQQVCTCAEMCYIFGGNALFELTPESASLAWSEYGARIERTVAIHDANGYECQ